VRVYDSLSPIGSCVVLIPFSTPGPEPEYRRYIAWGADIRSLCSRGEFVLVDHTAEEIVAVHDTGVGRRISPGDRSVDPVRRLQVEGAVRPLAVVVADVDAKDVLKLAATED
jgi:hypothetical protein